LDTLIEKRCSSAQQDLEQIKKIQWQFTDIAWTLFSRWCKQWLQYPKLTSLLNIL